MNDPIFEILKKVQRNYKKTALVRISSKKGRFVNRLETVVQKYRFIPLLYLFKNETTTDRQSYQAEVRTHQGNNKILFVYLIFFIVKL